MANHIQLDEGTSGKYTETVEVTSNIHRQVISLGNVAACKLTRGGTPLQSITCTAASTDYAITNAFSATAKYLVVYCNSVCKVSMGEATSATVGVYVAAGTPTVFPVTYDATEAYRKIHAQSPTAGAVVYVTEMAD